MPVNLPTPSSDFLANWLWAALAFLFAGLYIWSHFRKPRKTELDQPVDIRFAKEFASKKAVNLLFAEQNKLRLELERKLAEQRVELMDAIEKNRAEQREDNRQIFDLLRTLTAESKATAAVVENINRKITP
ncbi:hypothetical protein [Geminisphaera colitermitum]|uniref:hypothetical protein n=1 Tax=Geminisphaera colitermitum TaxID=1148786 RepID=UPI000158D58F|nr:hypothetical protein [Geminisphaera colitermitum]